MPVKRSQTQPPKPAPRWLPVALFLAVFATFLPCLRNSFINLDDKGYITRNPHVTPGVTWEGLKWSLSNTENSNWHPLTWVSHMVDCNLYGLNPAGHHSTNVLLHAFNALLVFLVLKRMTGARWQSFTAALLFGLHPLRVESVAWASERKDVLSAFFALLTLLAYALYSEQAKTNSPKTKKFYALALLCYALGLMSKPMLVTLPFALLLLDYWPLRRWQETSAKRLIIEKVPFFIMALACSALTMFAQASGNSITPVDALSVPARFANAVVSYVRYLGMTFWPAGLCAMYPHPGHWPTATVIGAAFVLVVITIVCVWRRRTMPFMAVGWFWFLGMLVPVIGIVQVGRQALADRYTYLPSIGILVAVVWGVTRLTEKWRNREMFARASVFAAGLACIVLTVRQIGYWKDSKILFTRAMDVTERNWIASAYLAGELQDRGELDAAIGMCHYSLQMNPYRGDVHCKLGELYMQKHQLQDARIEFEQAVAMDPEDFESHHGLAASLQDMGRLEEAIEQFKQALRIKPSYADAYSDLGNCYGMQGKIEDSLRCFQEAVKLKPRSADNHHDFGIGLAHAQRWDEAISQFQQAVQLDPSNERMRRDLQAAIDSKARMPPGPQIDADGRK